MKSTALAPLKADLKRHPSSKGSNHGEKSLLLTQNRVLPIAKVLGLEVELKSIDSTDAFLLWPLLVKALLGLEGKGFSTRSFADFIQRLKQACSFHLFKPAEDEGRVR